jgi:hypothetical protein
MKVQIAILNYYFGIPKVIFQFRNVLIESKNGHFNFECLYFSLKFDISILIFSIQIQKTYLDLQDNFCSLF